jgi:hypothetical protein
MNMLVSVSQQSLPGLIDRAAAALTGARTSAEVLEAKDMASVAYDAAKKAARLSKAKGAHDALIAAAHRAQADALEIEAQAKRRLADEYDAAQERGEIRSNGDKSFSGREKLSGPGIIPPKEMHEARTIRDAEEADPGIVRRTLDAAIDAGEEHTRAKVNRAVKAKGKRSRGPRFEPPQETEHDRDLRMLLGVWEASCQSAREAFLDAVTQ